MIGYSLSFCVKDIMTGKVAEADVEKIITSTCCRDEDDWDNLFKSYGAVYWRPFEALAVDLVKRLRAQDKIVQPRLTDPDYEKSINNGWWE